MVRATRRPNFQALMGLAALYALTGCAAGDLAALTAAPGKAGLTTFGGARSAIKESASQGASNPAAPADRPAASAAKPTKPARAAETDRPIAASPLHAGSVDDNANFPAFLTYLAGYDGEPLRTLDVRERYVLRVVDASGKTVPSADLVVKNGAETVFQAKSFADGRQLFHPRVHGLAGGCYTVSATKGGAAGSASFDCAQQQGDWVITLDGQAPAPARDLQVLFMLDATGSMGGEIDSLRATIDSIAARIHETQGQDARVSFGLVAYRDRGDDWVVRKKDFTDDLTAFGRTLDMIDADGGGDYPEDLEAGLATAMKELSWADQDAVRLTFMVADAPPQVSYEDSVPYTASALKAACKGVKLFSVGCSGLEVEGEYAMRQLSQFTMAKFMFLTRGGDSADGGGPVSHTVDSFDEARLDDMVVSTVRNELAALGK